MGRATRNPSKIALTDENGATFTHPRIAIYTSRLPGMDCRDPVYRDVIMYSLEFIFLLFI